MKKGFSVTSSLRAAILAAVSSLMFLPTSAQSAQKMRDMSLSVKKTNEILSSSGSPQIDGNYQNNQLNLNPGTPLQNTPFDYGNDNNINNLQGGSPGIFSDPDIARQLREINSRNNLNNNPNTLNNTLKNLPPTTRRGQNIQNVMTNFCSTAYNNKQNISEAQKTCMDTQRNQACERFARAAVNVQRVMSQAIDCEAGSGGYSLTGCDSIDASRLDLLKQYWQDEDTSYTVLYLPDLVLNSAANCAATSRTITNQ